MELARILSAPMCGWRRIGLRDVMGKKTSLYVNQKQFLNTLALNVLRAVIFDGSIFSFSWQ